MKPTNEQVRTFWEWCGVHPEKVYEQPCFQQGAYHLKYPKVNPNNLFKWAVPKLQEEGYRINLDLQNDIENGEWRVWIHKPYGNSWEARSENPALALFWTIWEVIQQESML